MTATSDLALVCRAVNSKDRMDLLVWIAAKPGVTLTVLEFGRPSSTVRANLAFLQDAGLIVRGSAADRSKPCRITSHGTRILDLGVDPSVWWALSRATPLALLGSVAEHPGLTSTGLAARHGLHRVVINVHIRRLLAAGLLAAEPDGRARRYLTTPLSRTILAILAPAPAEAGAR